MQRSGVKYEAKSARSYAPSVNRIHYKHHKKKQKNIEDEIDYESLITEDDEPVDSMYSERQMRILADSLYTSWDYKKPFLACANVGVFEKRPKKIMPIVPDMFLSLDVSPAKDFWKKKNRCYMISVFGKPPELVVEIVSNKVGNENSSKLRIYASMGIKYYVIFDPELHLFKTKLHVYELKNGRYVAFPWRDINKNGAWFKDLKLGLRIEKGLFHAMNTEWLTWFDDKGNTLYTGEEKARRAQAKAESVEKEVENERKKADNERKKAEKEHKRAENERIKAEIANKNAENERKKAEIANKNAENERKRTQQTEMHLQNALKELELLKASMKNQ